MPASWIFQTIFGNDFLEQSEMTYFCISFDIIEKEMC